MLCAILDRTDRIKVVDKPLIFPLNMWFKINYIYEKQNKDATSLTDSFKCNQVYVCLEAISCKNVE